MSIADHGRADADLATFQRYMSSIGRDILTKFDADFYTAVADLGIQDEIPDFQVNINMIMKRYEKIDIA